MTSNTGINISSYLVGNNIKKMLNYTTSTVTNGIFTSNSSNIEGSIGSIAIRMIAYLFAIMIIVIVILLFVHFFIKPVFILQPGTSGIIPIPGFDDGVLFWDHMNVGQILNKDLPIQNKSFDYSINIDVFVQNPLQFSKQPRIIFSRGATRNETPTGDTLLGLLNNYNLAVALLPDTNDLIVSVLNKDNNMENIIIPNIPIQESFRIGIIIMEKALEVYINGHLMKTRSFLSNPKDVKGDIYPSSGIEINMVKLRNLKIWPRVLTTPEIRYAKPALSDAKDFNAGPIPTSSTCTSR